MAKNGHFFPKMRDLEREPGPGVTGLFYGFGPPGRPPGGPAGPPNFDHFLVVGSKRKNGPPKKRHFFLEKK